MDFIHAIRLSEVSIRVLYVHPDGQPGIGFTGPPLSRGERGEHGQNSPSLRNPSGGTVPPHAPPLSGGEHMVAEGGSRGEHNFMTFQDFLSAPPQTGGSKES